MARKQTEAPVAPASIPVRFEIKLYGKTHVHRVETDVFLKGVGIHRAGELINWNMDCVDMTMSRETTVDLLTASLHMMDPDDQLAIIQPILEDLERLGHRFRGRQ